MPLRPLTSQPDGQPRASSLSLLGEGFTNAAPIDGYKVVAQYPHSTDSHTEGFLYLNGMFWEGTGINKRSAVMAIDPETGRTSQRRDLPSQYFGEGIVDWDPNIYEWTSKSHVCFVYDRLSLQLVKQFTYSGEGKSMTRTREELITRDGTSTLYFRDPVPYGKLATSSWRTEPRSSIGSKSSSSSKARFARMSGAQT